MINYLNSFCNYQLGPTIFSTLLFILLILCDIRVVNLQEGKKKFEKQTAKFCQSQERYLNLSTKKQDSVLQEVCLKCIFVQQKKYIF